MLVLEELYEESGCFDLDSMQGGQSENGYSRNHTNSMVNQQDSSSIAPAMEMELHHQNESQLVQELTQSETNHILSSYDHQTKLYGSNQQQMMNQDLQPVDLLNMFSMMKNLSICFANLTQKPSMENSSNGEAGAGAGNGVPKLTVDITNNLVKGKDGNGTKDFTIERQRRMHLNEMYATLSNIVPYPTKNDRASIIEDGTNYIKELKRTLNLLKIMVDKKKCGRERMKEQKNRKGVGIISDIKSEDNDQPKNGSALRSSWLHMKSMNSEVDVWITHDEVTIKLVQQKRINCLLFASKVLDELQLNLQHVAGGLIGDYYSFLFNSKIDEGSTVCVHAIANKIIEIVDRQYAALIVTRI